jgi:cobaltochelatase CobN
VLVAAALLPGNSHASGGNAALLVIDSDSYVAYEAIARTDLPEGFSARAFCLSDLERDAGAAEYIARCDVVIVDVMDDNLSRYIADRGLLAGHAVFAVRESADDASLEAKGFVFDAGIAVYYSNISASNISNMIKKALSDVLGAYIPFDPVKITPENGLYHPDGGGGGEGAVFERAEDYIKWNGGREGFDSGRPWLGVMFFSSSLVEGQKEAFEELIRHLEAGGFNVLPAFGTDLAVVDGYFLDDDRRPRVDAVLSFSLKFYMSLNGKLARSLIDLDVPLFNAMCLYSSTIEEWAESESGIPAADVVWLMATPEISGLIESIPLMGMTRETNPKNGGSMYRYELIPGMTERIIPRIRNWISLRNKPNGEKRVAILYYNHSQGKQNIGASYLNLFRSMEEITGNMRGAGYAISDDLRFAEDDMKELVLKGGRNVGSWAPGELDEMIASGTVVELPIAEYKRWFAQLPEDFRLRVTEKWGEPEDSGIMTRGGRIIIPVISMGGVVVMPEPARGITDDPMSLYHDTTLYPHHQYIAAYLWLKHEFGADVMVHLGTHATYEWLPGKQSGLSPSCPPELMITDIPNVYPYIIDDVGEGIQAKRRGRGAVISHLTPPLVEAEGYGEYLELSKLCGEYGTAESFASDTAASYLKKIDDMAGRLGIDKDLGLSGVKTADDVLAIARYLEDVEMTDIPFGLHTFGISPQDEAASSTAEAIIAQNPGAERAAVLNDLKSSGPSEMKNYLAALEGHYVPPSEGNDPVRNPGAIPTGRNFYGLSPGRLPTPAAWDLGREAANEIIGKYANENGSYPDKVAVVLWAVESLRNEGLNEATVLALVGAEPVWNPSGQVTGTRPIPGARLNRPRIDVAINASGLYRDLFPDKILFLDTAIRQAAAQDDIENFISRNDRRMRESLMDTGMSEEDAGRFSRARIFSEKPGSYGNRVEELTSASGLWNSDSEIADVFRRRTGFAYGTEFWGAPAEPALTENLRDARVAWHSVSSQYYALMDNDDMYMYLGGLSLAIRNISGRSPSTLIADTRTLGGVKMDDLEKSIGAEMRSRYLNPKWIEGMKAEGYAGAREMSNYAEYLWGWQVTTPEAVGRASWEQTFEVYVEDKYGLGLPEFMDAENAWAYQSLTGRMLEANRKGYWDASDEVVRKLAASYAASVVNRGLACCDHTCNNPVFHQMVLNIISIPGLTSPALAADFKLAVENAGQKTLDEMAAEREALLRNLSAARPAEANPSGPEADNTNESVKGFKMEDVENPRENTSLSSSGVEWFASLFVLALLALFYAGMRRGRGR